MLCVCVCVCVCVLFFRIIHIKESLTEILLVQDKTINTMHKPTNSVISKLYNSLSLSLSLSHSLSLSLPLPLITHTHTHIRTHIRTHTYIY